MAKRIAVGGLLVIVTACGGQLDSDAGRNGPASSPPNGGEQGLYFPPKAGEPEPVAADVGTPTAIAITEDRVLFTTSTTIVDGESLVAGALYAAHKGVGPAFALTVDRNGASFDALATDGTTAFVATSDSRLLAVPVAGGAVTTLAALAAPASTLAVAGNYVYFATDIGALARVAKAGGAVEQLATITGAVRGLDADDSAVYVATGAAEELPAGIVRVAVDGSGVKVLASGNEPCAMIRDGRRLFWTSLAAPKPASPEQPAKGEVRRLALDAQDVVTVTSGAFSACAIAADQQHLYFATTVPTALEVKTSAVRGSAVAGLGLMRAPIGGGDPVAIAEGVRALPKPGAVAVDASHVYWLTETAVLRLLK